MEEEKKQQMSVLIYPLVPSLLLVIQATGEDGIIHCVNLAFPEMGHLWANWCSC